MQVKKGKKGASAAEPKPPVTHPAAVKTAASTAGKDAQVRSCPFTKPTGVYAVRHVDHAINHKMRLPRGLR